jgi:hypothetical protein
VREYRHIATLAGVAHGTVGWVIPDLQSAGFVASINGKRKLLHIDVLFDRWAEAYLRAMRPKLLWGRYRSAVPGWWKDASMARFGAVLGGEAAAARLTSHIRPSEVTLYTHRVEARLIAENGLRKDARGDVEILRRFWSFDASNEIAPLPVVYADLMGKGDARCMEAAKLIRERFLARSE